MDYRSKTREPGGDWVACAGLPEDRTEFRPGRCAGTFRASALALPKEVEHWSPITLRGKLVKIGAKVVSHGRYVTFQLAEVAAPRERSRNILSLIDDLRRRPVPA